MNDGQWHHVVAQREGSVGRIFIDGVEAATGSGDIKWLNGDIAMSIGYNQRDNNHYFDGVMDDIRIIDQALTPDEIQRIMNNQGPVIENVTVNNGDAQRSRIDNVRVEFDQIIDVSEAIDAFQFTNTLTSESVEDVPTISEVDGKTVVDFAFMPGPTVTSSGGLMDGDYQLMVDAGMVTWLVIPLDGDADGTAGDDHLFGDDALDLFFRKYGDHNGDRLVDLPDFTMFRNAFGKIPGEAEYLAHFDADGDNLIALTDFTQFRQNFGT